MQKWVTWAKWRPFQGRFVIYMLGLDKINVYTKFEVSVFSHNKDMKGDEKMGVSGHPRSLAT